VIDKTHRFKGEDVAHLVKLRHFFAMTTAAYTQLPDYAHDNLWWWIDPILKPVIESYCHQQLKEGDAHFDAKADFYLCGLPGQWQKIPGGARGIAELMPGDWMRFPWAVVLTYGLEMFIWRVWDGAW
jgi:hypothetical protein